MNRYREHDKMGAAIGGRGLLVIVILVVFFGLLGGGIWFAKVQTSGVKGAGDVKRTNNSAPNRIAAQKEFEALYAGVIAADKRIDQAAAALKRSPNDYTAQVRYDGSLSFCVGLVADYNAKARGTTSMDWRSADLPPQILDLDPTTDCKESAR